MLSSSASVRSPPNHTNASPLFPSSSSSSSTSPTNLSSSSSVSESGARRRNKIKDDAIRKKVDQELSRKPSRLTNDSPSILPSSTSSSSSSSSSFTSHIPTLTSTSPFANAKAGTVASLRSSPPVTIRHTCRVVEAAQLMAAKRCDALLIIDHTESLCGIVTDKDLAFRVVAEGLDANTTKVLDIMTKSVQFANTYQTATDALSTMISGGFRHLPVMDKDGDVVGVLDITKCLYEALRRLEKLDGSSKKLTEALMDVQQHMENKLPPLFFQHCEAMKQKLLCPDLRSLMDMEPDFPPEVSTKATVRDAVKAMKQAKSTAVLIFEDKHRLAGIFTTKDVVLRVMAVKADPTTTSIIRVMTPHPDSVPESTSIHTALKMMQENHYLHLPVTDADKNVIGLMDVLKLTYSLLEKLNATREGPLQTDFWSSTYLPLDPILPSSTSHHPSSSSALETDPNTFCSIQPSDSASMVSESQLTYTSSSHVPSDPYIFTFKFQDPLTLSFHRVTSPIALSSLLHLIQKKCPSEQYHWNALMYTDDDGDTVMLQTDADLVHAVSLARGQGLKKLTLTLSLTTPSSASSQSPSPSLAPIPPPPTTTPTSAFGEQFNPVASSSSTASSTSSSIPSNLDFFHPSSLTYVGIGVAVTLSVLGLVSVFKR